VDPAVALVQAYLQFNGFFTVCEYPVIEAVQKGQYRSATDLDVLAVRFPGAGRLIPATDGKKKSEVMLSMGDPTLECSDERLEFIIAEVKEGRAELNKGARTPAVIRAALTRFGSFNQNHIDALVGQLIQNGEATTPGRHARVRLFAFGGHKAPHASGRYTIVTLRHVIRFIEDLEERFADYLPLVQFKDPAMGLLSILAKARLGKHVLDDDEPTITRVTDPDAGRDGRGDAPAPQ